MRREFAPSIAPFAFDEVRDARERLGVRFDGVRAPTAHASATDP
jgi:hypothetical protein